MQDKNLQVRLPIEMHLQFKQFANIKGVSMGEIVKEMIAEKLGKEHVCEYGYSHIPNEETIKTIAGDEDPANYTEYKTIEDYLKHAQELREKYAPNRSRD